MLQENYMKLKYHYPLWVILLYIMNKVLLEHSHPHSLHTVFTITAELRYVSETTWAGTAWYIYYLLPGILQKNLPTPDQEAR